MNVIEFTAEVVFTFSVRSLSPGPLFLANLIYGSKGGYHSGIKIALGHTIESIFEYSSFTLTEESVRIIGLIGGIVIIIFSIAQISSIIRKREVIADIHNKRSRYREEAHHF